tara:strand:+ start:1114 stop:1302 length:189 start_codon:yes stop_codon:yes gene_type:complete
MEEKYKQELREKITNMQETADSKSWCNDPEAISTAKAAMEIIKELEDALGEISDLIHEELES